MKENLKLREAVFRKMGWEPGLKMDQGQWWLVVNLPMVEKRWEVTAKYLVKFLYDIKDSAWLYEISTGLDGRLKFHWYDDSRVDRCAEAEIKEDNIAEAACQAFMEVTL